MVGCWLVVGWLVVVGWLLLLLLLLLFRGSLGEFKKQSDLFQLPKKYNNNNNNNNNNNSNHNTLGLFFGTNESM